MSPTGDGRQRSDSSSHDSVYDGYASPDDPEGPLEDSMEPMSPKGRDRESSDSSSYSVQDRYTSPQPERHSEDCIEPVFSRYNFESLHLPPQTPDLPYWQEARTTLMDVLHGKYPAVSSVSFDGIGPLRKTKEVEVLSVASLLFSPAIPSRQVAQRALAAFHDHPVTASTLAWFRTVEGTMGMSYETLVKALRTHDVMEVKTGLCSNR